MEIYFIVGGIIHLLMVTICFMVSKETFNRLDHTFLIYGLVVLLPIVNVLMTLMLMDITLRSYKRGFEEKQGEVGTLSRQLINEERKYEDLERRKFLRIKVNDKFHVPNTDEWKDGFRNTECTIIEIGDDVVVRNKINNTRWSVKWHHLQYMVFLSNEPVKPFEFIQ